MEYIDFTEQLIRPGMTGLEGTVYWQAHNAKIVITKHGMIARA